MLYIVNGEETKVFTADKEIEKAIEKGNIFTSQEDAEIYKKILSRNNVRKQKPTAEITEENKRAKEEFRQIINNGLLKTLKEKNNLLNDFQKTIGIVSSFLEIDNLEQSRKRMAHLISFEKDNDVEVGEEHIKMLNEIFLSMKGLSNSEAKEYINELYYIIDRQMKERNKDLSVNDIDLDFK